MTYDDPGRTMTQYKIDLDFQELDPITEDDYGKFDEIVDPEKAYYVQQLKTQFLIIK